MRPLLLTSLCLCCMAIGFGQDKTKTSLRLEKAEALFNAALIQHFIHPNQLDTKNWAQCQDSMENLIGKFEEDFIAIRFEKAFRSAEVTNYFTPVFIYADGREFSFPAFNILQ